MAIRSLIVAPQWIGDAVMSQPLLARLAARGERLTVGALPGVAPVFRAMPGVDAVLEWPFRHGRLDWANRRRTAAALRGRFERAYVLPNSLKSALLPWWAGIAQRVGYLGESRRWLLSDRRPNPAGRPPMVAFYAALAEPGDQPPGRFGRASRGADRSERPRLVLPTAALDAATAATAVSRGAFWVIAPGAEYGPAKRWPAEHVVALAGALIAAHGQPVLLLGSPAERALCDAIAAEVGAGCRALAGRRTLLEGMALIAAARGVVTNDSGLMHVAAAFDVPQVAVFGSTSPLHTPPANPRARVLWLKDELQLDCMPCFERVCRYGHTACLNEVRPERVGSALAEAVAGSGAPASAPTPVDCGVDGASAVSLDATAAAAGVGAPTVQVASLPT